MKIRDLFESPPLPDAWDKDVFRTNVPFAKRVRYAAERAAKIGKGSSRVAFEIPYKGRPTILKIALNRKGIAQNHEEVQLLGDWHLKGMEITIPMIDYDEANGGNITWIHMEKATKITDSQFKRFCGGTPGELVTWAMRKHGHKVWGGEGKIDEESELAQAMLDLAGSYTHLAFADFTRKANWGLYKGKPVIIDMGATNEVIDTYYR